MLQRKFKLREDEGEDSIHYGYVANDQDQPQGRFQWAGTYADIDGGQADLLQNTETEQWVYVRNMFGKSAPKVWKPNTAPHSPDREIVKQATETLAARLTRSEKAPTGDIGRMDFRFEASKGVLFYVRSLPSGYRPQPGVQTIEVDAQTLESRIQQAQMDRLNAPRTGEFASGQYLYLRVPQSMVGDDVKPWDERGKLVFPGHSHTPSEFEGPQGLQRYQQLQQAAQKVDALGGLQRNQQVTYTGEAKGEGRDGGQVAKMAGLNAAAYALARNLPNASSTPWERPHVRGARLGGATTAANLVPGTSATNSHMIPYERRILELSKLADPQHPLVVRFSVQTHGNTLLPVVITIAYEFTNGVQPRRDGQLLRKSHWRGEQEFQPLLGTVIDRTSRDLMWDLPMMSLPPVYPWGEEEDMEIAHS